MSTDTDDLTSRVTELERWRGVTDTKLAVDFNERKHIDARFDRVERAIALINNNFSKVLWGLAGVVLMQIARWVMAGNLFDVGV